MAHHPHDAKRLADTPIAIVGLGGLFPRSGDLREFWSNIAESVDCITDVPETHWRIEDYYDPDPATPDKTYCRRGGFIPTVDFDPLEFGLPPSTLEVTDVLQVLSLVVAKQTLADAGVHDGDWYDSSRTGVVLGVTGANSLTQPLATRLQTPMLKKVALACGIDAEKTEEIADKFAEAFAPWEENSFPGMLGNVVAGRIANRFDFGATNSTVDAACASSLAAVHNAAMELVSGRADLMLSGGCDAENTIFMYLCFSKTPAFSKTEHIRPFDADADGTLIGEGIGMLAMKRLADAERDGDQIYSVLRGIGSSSDGRFQSIYAPRASGQSLALRRAYVDADVAPTDIGLVECHGTGTAVGDQIELSALRDVYEEAGAEPGSVAVGSVKSQIGHTKAAAGAAGLIKLSLSLHQKVLPPTINVSTPAAALEGSPFHVAATARPWVVDRQRPARRAAVSSFGFGGTNFHCVLGEHEPHEGGDQPPLRVLQRVARVHLWHAADPADLLAAVESGDDGLRGAEEQVPADHARLAVVARDAAELARLRDQAADRLRQAPGTDFELPTGVYYRRSGQLPGRVAVLCAGQGSQYVGMGAAAALAVPPVRAALDDASLATDLRPSLPSVMFPATAFDPAQADEQEALLRRTEYAQPAIGAVSAGQFRYLAELGFAPDGALGHSFGELTALWCAGSLTDEQLFGLAAARGAAMAAVGGDADRGAMAAVPVGVEQVERLLDGHPDVTVCNINSPQQVVVGGGTAAVEALVRACRAQDVNATRLPVAAAFHTPYVAHAVASFRAAVDTVDVAPPNLDVYANTDGAAYGTDVAHNRDVLVEQLLRPVAFAPRLREMYADGYRVFVEIGPRTVLAGLADRTFHEYGDTVVLSADTGPRGDGDRALKQVAARLAVLGLPLTGFNRFTAPPATAGTAKPKGMRIAMTGVNHLSDARRAHRADLEEAAAAAVAQQEVAQQEVAQPQAAQPQVAPPAPAAAPPAVTASTPVAAGQPVPAAPPPSHQATTDGVLTGHLSMHEEYLSGQLRIADRLANVLQQHADGATAGPGVIEGIVAVTEHSVAIGRSHIHASEVLRSLVQMDHGVHVPAASFVEPVAAPAVRIWAPSLPQTGNDGSVTNGHGAVALAPAPAPVPAREIVAAPAPVPAPAPVAAPTPVPTFVAPVADPPDPGAVPTSPTPSDAPAAADGAAGGATAEDVSAILLDIVAEKTGYPSDMLDASMDIEADLGIDSIKRVEIMGALRERFPASEAASPERLAELRTLGDITGFVADAASDGAAGGTVSADPKAREGAPGIGRAQAYLTPLPVPDLLDAPFRARTAILTGTDPLTDRLGAALTAAGWSVHGAQAQLPAGAAPDLVVHLADDPATALSDALLLARDTQRGLEERARSGRAAFLTVTRLDGRLGLGGVDLDRARLGGLPGLVKTLAIEAPTLFCRAVDLAPELSAQECVRLLLAELHDARPDLPQVAHGADGTRRTVGLRTGADAEGAADDGLPPSGEVPPISSDDLLVVTGGGRGVTAACVLELARRHRPGLLLFGRTEPADEPAWAAGVEEKSLRAAVAGHLRAEGTKPLPRDVERITRDLLARREIRDTIAAIRSAGAAVEYVPVDVTDVAATAAALDGYRDRITGVVHGAGVLADRLVVDKSGPDIERVLAPKLDGLQSVLSAVDPARLRHVVLFSSVAGFFGNRAQSDYAMANEALNRIACSLKREHPGARVTAVNWGAWEGGMVSPELAAMFAERGVPLIPLDQGVRLFAEQFDPRRAADVVCVAGPTVPLSTPEPPAAAADGELVVRRDLASLRADPVLADHALGGVPVLPATAAIGAVLNVAEASGRVRPAGQLRGFAVLNGLRLADPAPAYLEFALSQGSAGTAVLVRDSDGRPRYRAEVGPPPAPAAPLTGLPAVDGGEQAHAYSGGALFHGPALRGIATVLAQDANRLVLGAHMPDVPIAGGAYRTARYSPALADLLLQAALVRVHRSTGRNTLPTAVGSVEVHDVLPDDGRFLVVVDDYPESGTAQAFRCTVTACAPDGRVLLRFRDVEVVASPGLTEQFAHATSRPTA